MAIRRGPLAAPDDATKVFKVDNGDGSSIPAWSSGFPVDMAIERAVNATDNTRISSRLTGTGFMYTDTNDPEYTNQYREFDYMDGWWSQVKNSPDYSWMWKRAPSYFDVVATKSTNGNVNHNLGVAAEMVWYKRRDSADDWFVCTAANGYLKLNSTASSFGSGNGSYLTNAYGAQVTSTTVHTGYNFTGVTTADMIIYLFATAAGVSKVGSYTGNGSSQNIDCGFSSGARFILIKSATDAGSWFVHDSVRGIVAGNDPRLKLDQNQAEMSADYVDPLSSGFTVNGPGNNDNGQTYIFYAIA